MKPLIRATSHNSRADTLREQAAAQGSAPLGSPRAPSPPPPQNAAAARGPLAEAALWKRRAAHPRWTDALSLLSNLQHPRPREKSLCRKNNTQPRARGDGTFAAAPANTTAGLFCFIHPVECRPLPHAQTRRARKSSAVYSIVN